MSKLFGYAVAGAVFFAQAAEACNNSTNSTSSDDSGATSSSSNNSLILSCVSIVFSGIATAIGAFAYYKQKTSLHETHNTVATVSANKKTGEFSFKVQTNDVEIHGITNVQMKGKDVAAKSESKEDDASGIEPRRSDISILVENDTQSDKLRADHHSGLVKLIGGIAHDFLGKDSDEVALEGHHEEV
jgi:hypothetical protein